MQFANKINEVLVGIMETIPEPDGAAKDGTDKMPAQKTKGKDEPELTLIIDATCSPEDIRFPQDESLLNEAREKLEKMIDQLFRQSGDSVKARTYREVARKDHLSFAKSKKRTEENTRDAVGKQLRYVARDIGHVQAYLERGLELDKKWETLFETIKALYEQQKKMYDERTHHVEDRIEVERKFSLGKRSYCLSLIRMRLPETEKFAVAMGILVSNLFTTGLARLFLYLLENGTLKPEYIMDGIVLE